MRIAVSLALAAGLAFAAGFGIAGQPEGQTQGQPQAVAQAGAEPPAPVSNAIPVPDGPVVKKQELEGGLMLEDIKIGEGYEVKPGGAVVAHYHGTLKSDGKVFDSSFERGEPVGFPLSGVIEGWGKGVPGMKIGGVRKLTIPAALAYGEMGRPPTIPANADLVFVIQLVNAVQVEDITVGTGEEARFPWVAVCSHVIKDAEGKELERSDSAKPYIWIPNELQGLNYGLDGMKVGGKRKIVIPKEMNVAPPGLPVTRPQNVDLTVELELLNVRNLPGR
ncbi:MAG: FKBP-type peptidyl-prolyl cis-trans isomerase [Planctomycetota bacterium]|nr:FKBP-type peptidyl-prolyl cis-trans isomerase [Planctomycetota bacterium]